MSTPQFSPQSVQVGGNSVTVSVQVLDITGAAVPGETVVISTTDPAIPQQTATDPQNIGTYSATFSSSNTPGPVTFTATDTSTPTVLPVKATLTQTPGPAAMMSLGLSQSSVPVGGTSVTATVTVTDGMGNGVSGESVTVSGSSGFPPQTGTTNASGTYTATLHSTTVPGPVTISAVDNTTPGVVPNPATQTLTQVPGPAKTISVAVNPTSIPADGTSTAVATASVTDFYGNPINNDNVVISSSDAVSATVPQGNGFYKATITSSNTPGTVSVTATDYSVSPPIEPPTPTTFTQGPSYAFPSLTVLPSRSLLTNQIATLIAALPGPQSGTVTFSDGFLSIPGCQNVAASPSSPAACQAAFAAANSPASITAVFSPNGSNATLGSNTVAVTVGRGATSTSLALSSSPAGTGVPETYTATVTPHNAGAVGPTGSVEFEQGGKPIGPCSQVPLDSTGSASCTVKYSSPGSHKVWAVYSGDANFSGSTSRTFTVPVTAAGAINATMTWFYNYHPRYTVFTALQVNAVAVGTKVMVICKGRGCPYSKHMSTLHLRHGLRCTGRGRHKCGSSTGPISLIKAFRSHHLAVGTQLVVEIRRPGFVGKYYSFTIRSGRGPLIRISCLAPGLNNPGVGCS